MRQHKKNNINTPNALYSLGALALAGLFVWSLVSDKPPVAYDPQSHCQKGKAQPQVTVLIDPSTPFNPSQQVQFQRLSAYLKQALPENAKFTLYRLEETVAIPPTPVFNACYPGKQQRGMGSVQRKAVKAFQAEFTTAMQGFTKAKEEATSPLLEGIYTVAHTLPWTGQGSELIIFGDLLQNSQLLSNYGKKPYFPTFKTFYASQKRYLEAHKLDLKNVKVTIFQLTNAPLSSQQQVEKSQQFWSDYFHFQQAETVQFCSLDAHAQPHCLIVSPTKGN
jgi:hypothetical protein